MRLGRLLRLVLFLPGEEIMKTVIIVDPDYAVNDIGNVISRHGFIALVMPEAQTALDSVKNGMAVDLVITELLLPDMDGMEFLQAIKQQAPKLPVLVATAGYSIENYLQAMCAGVFDYLPKPVRDADLGRCAHHAVNFTGCGPISCQAA